MVDEPDGEKTLKVFIIGAPVDSLNLKRIEGNMAHYRLPGTSLDIINISGDSGDKNSIDAGMFMSLYRTNEQTAREKDSVISSLEKELAGYRASQLPVSNIAAEASVLFPAVDSIALARAEMTSIKSDSSAPIHNSRYKCVGTYGSGPKGKASQVAAKKAWKFPCGYFLRAGVKRDSGF